MSIIDAGLRRNELLNLKMGDVDSKPYMLYIIRKVLNTDWFPFTLYTRTAQTQKFKNNGDLYPCIRKKSAKN
jgi:integrase